MFLSCFLCNAFSHTRVSWRDSALYKCIDHYEMSTDYNSLPRPACKYHHMCVRNDAMHMSTEMMLSMHMSTEMMLSMHMSTEMMLCT